MAVAGGPWGDCGACPCAYPTGKTFGTKPHSECQCCKADLHNICGLFEETEGADDFGHVHWCGPACKAASLASRGGGGGGAAAAAAAAPLQPQLLLQQHPPARLASRGALAPPALTLPTVLRQAPAAARGARPPVPQQASARGPLALALPPVSAWTCPRSAACTTSGCPCTSCMGSAASAACTATATGDLL